MKNVFTFFALLVLSSSAYAAKIGAAGCGLGNVFFGKDTQILASTTNGSSGTQTFGISSGTSNCEAGNRSARLENFIEVNQIAFSNDAARGEGETISGVASLLGCNNTAALGAELKANYEAIFSRPDASSAEVSNGVQNLIERNTQLNQSCVGA